MGLSEAVSGGGTSEHSNRGGPNPVFRVDNQSREVQIQTHSGVFVRRLRIPPRFHPCKTLRVSLNKRSVVKQGKKATHICSRIEGSIPGPEKVHGNVSKSDSVSSYGQLNSGSLHKQRGRNPLSGDVCSPVEDHNLVNHYLITHKAATFQVA